MNKYCILGIVGMTLNLAFLVLFDNPISWKIILLLGFFSGTYGAFANVGVSEQ